MEEIWQEIGWTLGKYSISSLGRLRSNYRYSGRGHIKKDEGQILKMQINKNGYYFGNITVIIDGKGVERLVKIHRLVCEAFHSNPENKSQVNHKDCNKLNNRADNLEWCTPRENTLHAQANGRIKTKKPYEYKTTRCYHTKKVLDTNTGQIFSSTKDAAAYIGMTVKKLTRLLSGERPNTTSLKYEGTRNVVTYDYKPLQPRKYTTRKK